MLVMSLLTHTTTLHTIFMLSSVEGVAVLYVQLSFLFVCRKKFLLWPPSAYDSLILYPCFHHYYRQTYYTYTDSPSTIPTLIEVCVCVCVCVRACVCACMHACVCVPVCALNTHACVLLQLSI